MHVRVASRKSALALQQTQWVIGELQKLSPETTFEIVPVVTKGDRILDVALSKVGGKGLFVSEVEEQLRLGKADFAVHSLKDVPAQLADGLHLAAIPAREDPRDAFISKQARTFSQLRPGTVVGTSSLRRIAQLQAARPDLTFKPVRGNIDTRLRKLDEGEFDAIILAAAGLHRMGWADKIDEYLALDVCLPAMGQGLLGIEARKEDTAVNALLQHISDDVSVRRAQAERSLLLHLNGSCQVPVAGFCEAKEDGTLHLQGLVAGVDGKVIMRAEGTGDDPEKLGERVAHALFQQGANCLLTESPAF